MSSYNYGARLYSRVKKAYFFTLAYGTSACAVLSVVCLTASGSIIRQFRDDPEVVAIGTPALRLQCIACFVCVLFQCTNMLYQSVGKSMGASFLAALRNGFCFIPLILVLPRVFGVNGMIAAQPAADLLAALITLPFGIYLVATLPPDGETAR